MAKLRGSGAHPHIPRQAPAPFAGLSLSGLRAAALVRGLALAFDSGVIVVRDGERVLHQAATLNEAHAWLERL